MRSPFRYEFYLAALLAAGAGGCTPPADPATDAETASVEEPATEPSGRPAPDTFAGSAWRVTADDGARYVTYLDPEDRYRDFRNGDLWQQGSWRLVEGPEIRELCFTPDAETAEETCWRPGRMKDETLIANGEDDRRIELTRAPYSPPSEAADEDAQADSGQAE